MTTSMPISVLENILREVNKDTELERLAKEEAEKQAEKNKEKVEKLKEILDSERSTKEGESECSINGKITLIQNQNTGKKSKKSTKKMTTTQK